MYRFNTIFIKIAAIYFCKYMRDYSTVYMERKRDWNNLNSFEKKKKNKVGGINLPGFKIHYIAIVIKAVILVRGGSREQNREIRN